MMQVFSNNTYDTRNKELCSTIFLGHTFENGGNINTSFQHYDAQARFKTTTWALVSAGSANQQ
jgi:hypothetical protein